MPESKIISLEDTKRIFSNKTNKKIVLVGGCYDILHFGHLAFLKKAKEEGDLLAVALESDEFIIKSKKRQPVHNQQQRAHILASLEFVDVVIMLPYMQGHDDYLNLVKQVRPSIIAITKGDPKYSYKKNHADAVGAEVKEVIELEKSFSSSQILQYADILGD